MAKNKSHARKDFPVKDLAVSVGAAGRGGASLETIAPTPTPIVRAGLQGR